MAVTIEHGYIKFTATGTYTGRLEPSFYRWHSPTALDHTCVLLDGYGRELFSAKAEAANAVNLKPHTSRRKGKYVHDLSATLSSGVLEVHFKTLG